MELTIADINTIIEQVEEFCFSYVLNNRRAEYCDFCQNVSQRFDFDIENSEYKAVNKYLKQKFFRNKIMHLTISDINEFLFDIHANNIEIAFYFDKNKVAPFYFDEVFIDSDYETFLNEFPKNYYYYNGKTINKKAFIRFSQFILLDHGDLFVKS
jgi:hypothetical protein